MLQPLGSSFVDMMIGSLTVKPLSVLVKQADFSHTLMTTVVDIRGLPYNGREEGLPIRLHWGHFPGNTLTYYGYVHHTEPYYDKLTNNQVKLVCLSASAALSQPIQKSWANVTADAVAKDIIEDAYLSADVQPHTTVWPALVATGQTAWEYLNSLAEKIGYRLSPRGTDIRFKSLIKLFGEGYANAPTLSMGAELLRFRLAHEEDAGLAVQRTVSGVGQRDGRLFTVTDAGSTVVKLGSETPAPTTAVPASDLVDSPGAGAAQLAGQTAAERLAYAATAEVEGDAMYAPGQLVYLAGLEFTQNGHWYVEGAEHDVNLRDGTYTTYLALRRDALGALVAAPQPTVIKPRLRQKPTGEVVGAVPPATLVNGQWRSSWARRAS